MQDQSSRYSLCLCQKGYVHNNSCEMHFFSFFQKRIDIYFINIVSQRQYCESCFCVVYICLISYCTILCFESHNSTIQCIFPMLIYVTVLNEWTVSQLSFMTNYNSKWLIFIQCKTKQSCSEYLIHLVVLRALCCTTCSFLYGPF